MKTPNGDRLPGTVLVLNEWVHLVLTVDSAGTMRLYRSGKLIATELGLVCPKKPPGPSIGSATTIRPTTSKAVGRNPHLRAGRRSHAVGPSWKPTPTDLMHPGL